RDTAVNGTNQALKQGLKETFFNALDESGVDVSQIEFAVSWGMITSEIGLMEIPHLWAPAGVKDLADSMKRVHDTSVFPVDIPIYFIRGIKNRFDPDSATIQDVGVLDFMRGEETQTAGLLAGYSIDLPVTVMVLSSHTKFISINRKEKILGSITTVSGQVYEAIIKNTFIGKSIREDSEEPQEFFDGSIIDSSYRWVENSGFLRSLLMPRFLDTLLDTKWYQRKLFVESLIASEDMKSMNQFQPLGFPSDTNFILIGSGRRCAIYEYLLKNKVGINKDIVKITADDEVDMLGIRGAISIANLAGIMQREEI
ncbi:MAG: 2-dehydro-3-deoxygalactonokinase, partial [Spirochaetota bacterium]